MSGTGYCNCSELRQEVSRLTTTNLELVERERKLRDGLNSFRAGFVGLGMENSVMAVDELLATPPSSLGKRVEKVIACANELKELNPNNYNDDDVREQNFVVVKVLKALNDLDALSGGTK